ncbi:MAG: hypothetical protein EPO23_12205 [Xanthobacteraceae bacterium]|nr:MAG: hypothetical protein EPO23_12205 [Xanthobacteraceae bacterium]
MSLQDMINNLLDPYSRQARHFPGLLSVFPPLITALAWFPALLMSNIGTILLTIITSCGLLYLLGSWARTRGKKVEKRLLEEWGGWPTTIFLRHSGPLDPSTRGRYHTFLAANVPGIVMPSAADEGADPKAADAVYASAVKCLKELVRKTAPLVDKENAQYGFRRNLRGMKPIAITVCFVAAIGTLLAIALTAPTFMPADLAAAARNTPVPIWVAFAVDVVAIIGWVAIVNDAWIRQAGDQYADALLATCDRAPPKKAVGDGSAASGKKSRKNTAKAEKQEGNA